MVYAELFSNAVALVSASFFVGQFLLAECGKCKKKSGTQTKSAMLAAANKPTPSPVVKPAAIPAPANPSAPSAPAAATNDLPKATTPKADAPPVEKKEEPKPDEPKANEKEKEKDKEKEAAGDGTADKKEESKPEKEPEKAAPAEAPKKEEKKTVKKESMKNKKKVSQVEEHTPPDPEPDAPSLNETQPSASKKVGHDDDTVKHVASIKEDKQQSEG